MKKLLILMLVLSFLVLILGVIQLSGSPKYPLCRFVCVCDIPTQQLCYTDAMVLTNCVHWCEY